MDVRLADCQIEGCDEPARYEVFQAKKRLYVCEQHFCLLGRLKEAEGVIVIRKTGRGRKSILGGKESEEENF